MELGWREFAKFCYANRIEGVILESGVVVS